MEFRVEETVAMSTRGDVGEERVTVEGIHRRIIRHNISDNIRDIHRPPVVEKHRPKGTVSARPISCLRTSVRGWRVCPEMAGGAG